MMVSRASKTNYDIYQVLILAPRKIVLRFTTNSKPLLLSQGNSRKHAQKLLSIFADIYQVYMRGWDPNRKWGGVGTVGCGLARN